MHALAVQMTYLCAIHGLSHSTMCKEVNGIGAQWDVTTQLFSDLAEELGMEGAQ